MPQKKLQANYKTKRIGVLTSGGDAPGMNAAIRAIVRRAAYSGIETVGIRNGYAGLIQGHLGRLNVGSVGNILQRGGTFLGSSRSPEFRTKAGRKKAYTVLKAWEISTLITLGGDGTMAGAGYLSKEFPLQVLGIPCTIDNDLWGTDLSIGFDTAVNTAVDSIDKIRDTADSHGRVFIVEVMGRNTGHLAMETAMAVGAEYAVVPELRFRLSSLVSKIQRGIDRGKTGSIVIVAEEGTPGYALDLAKQLKRYIDRDIRAVVLGHLQRGGNPSATDRNLGSRFGVAAVEAALRGETRVMIGLENKEIRIVPFSRIVGKRRRASTLTLKAIDILSI